ncbi:MAG: hypothetical protein V1707_02105 [bacterium]
MTISYARTLSKALAFPIAVLALNFLTVDLYDIWPSYDKLLHFLGGASIAVMWFIILKALIASQRASIAPWWLSCLLLFGLVAVVGITWEWYEFFWDFQFGTLFQPSIADTMWDLFYDLAGGFLASYILTVRQQ